MENKRSGLSKLIADWWDLLTDTKRQMHWSPDEYYARWMGDGKIQIGRVVPTGVYDAHGYKVANLEDAVTIEKPDWADNVSDFQLHDSDYYVKRYLEEHDKTGGTTIKDAFRQMAEMNLVIGYNILENRGLQEQNLAGGK